MQPTELTLVADPARAGLTIIPTSTPLTRLNYFDGKFLRAADLSLDQNYERLLVRLATRGGGSGVVHGFELDATGAGSNTAVLRSGLALTPTGTVLYLPSDASLSLVDLLSKSGDASFDPHAGTAGSPDFAGCAAGADQSPDIVLAPQPIYVITLASDEALCGEEERFGELCSNACLTDVDRPRRVEGIRIRARRLELGALPSSTAVPFTALHYRSRIATAYFEAEQQQVASLISAVGLASPAWCAGAGVADGDEVPIAVLTADGITFSFLDLWIARRELMVEPARRYWAMRMAMRPWDVFLAQILQFQCQLRDPASSGGGPGPDPCADERSALRNLRDVLAEISPTLQLDERTLQRYRALADDATALLAAPSAPTSASGSLLVDRGFVTTPSAGYLPVDPKADVVAQVRAQFGPGVDLRFCVAAADVVPGLLEDSQHQRRISLTAGLDDPAQRPPVDVIIPDGTIASSEQQAPAWVGAIQLIPRARITGAAIVESGSALALRGLARDDSTTGWTWAVAAFGLADQRLAVERVLRTMAGPMLGAQANDGEQEVPITPDSLHAERVPLDRLTLLANRERTLAAARRMRISASSFGDRPVGQPEPALALDAGEGRPVAVWLDATVSAPVSSAQPGAVLSCSLRGALYSRAGSNPVLLSVKLAGSLRVTGRRSDLTAAGRPETIVETALTATLDPFSVTGSVHDGPPTPFTQQLEWHFTSDADGAPRLVAFSAAQGDGQQRAFFSANFSANSTASDAGRAEVGVTNQSEGGIGKLLVAPEWTAPVAGTASGASVLASATGQRIDAALDPGSTARDLAEAAIEAIGAELSLPDRDPQFAERARALLFPEPQQGAQTITATRDWVLFHRRRSVDCTDVTVAPALRHYRAYHATVRSRDELARFAKLLSTYVRNASELIDTEGLSSSTKAAIERRGSVPLLRTRVPVDDLGFELVDTVDFAAGSDSLASSLQRLRSAWSATDRGSSLVWSGGGDVGPGDGADVVRRRVMAYRAALAGLIDSSATPAPVVLADLPDEFTGIGTDGAIFTIGLLETSVQVTRQLLVRVETAQLERLLGIARNTVGGELSEVTEAVLRTVAPQVKISAADFHAVQFTGTTMSDATAQDVRAWWGDFSGNPPSEAQLFAAAGADLEAETERGAAVLTLLAGDPSRITADTIKQVTSGNAVTALVRSG